MEDRIVFTNPDGSCGVIIPAPNSGLTIDEIMAKDVPAGSTNVRKITTAELPSDRLFRNAWDDSNPEEFVGINITKAKERAHEIRRLDREIKMQPLDKEAGFVSTTPARQSEIVTEKQAILDANATVQTAIDNAVDETELRAAISGLVQ